MFISIRFITWYTRRPRLMTRRQFVIDTFSAMTDVTPIPSQSVTSNANLLDDFFGAPVPTAASTATDSGISLVAGRSETGQLEFGRSHFSWHVIYYLVEICQHNIFFMATKMKFIHRI